MLTTAFDEGLSNSIDILPCLVSSPSFQKQVPSVVTDAYPSLDRTNRSAASSRDLIGDGKYVEYEKISSHSWSSSEGFGARFSKGMIKPNLSQSYTQRSDMNLTVQCNEIDLAVQFYRLGVRGCHS